MVSATGMLLNGRRYDSEHPGALPDGTISDDAELTRGDEVVLPRKTEGTVNL